MNDTRYMISETARMLQVEPHVLRYWEEELKIQVKRNEMGHRYYTDKDIQTFLRVKELKKSGMQLRAIRKMLDEQGETTEEEVLPTIREERVVPFVRPDSSGLQDTACENGDKLSEGYTLRNVRKSVAGGTLSENRETYENQSTKKHVFVEKDKPSGKQSKEDRFYQIMERLIDELNTEEGKEGRYRKLDEAIRRHQQSRKMVAAAMEDGKKEKKKEKSQKKIWKHKNKR